VEILETYVQWFELLDLVITNVYVLAKENKCFFNKRKTKKQNVYVLNW